MDEMLVDPGVSYRSDHMGVAQLDHTHHSLSRILVLVDPFLVQYIIPEEGFVRI